MYVADAVRPVEGRGRAVAVVGSTAMRAAELMTILDLSEDELCTVLDADPLTLLSGQAEHAPELRILLDLLEDARRQAGDPVLRRWVRAAGPSGRPLDALLVRDFASFENQLAALQERGFVLRAPGR